MVAIERDFVSRHSRDFVGIRPQVWTAVGFATMFLTIGAWVARGFTDNGFRLGSEFAWRFSFLIYFLAIVAGPSARLIPSPLLRRLCEERRQLIWGFCASYAIYLLSIFLPNLLLPVRSGPDGLTAGMTMFVVFGASLCGIIAFAARRDAARTFGEKARAAVMGVGMGTFWLIYAFGGLAHITGPHRPDIFHGLSLSLMIGALLLRFADCLIAKFRVRGRSA